MTREEKIKYLLALRDGAKEPEKKIFAHKTIIHNLSIKRCSEDGSSIVGNLIQVSAYNQRIKGYSYRSIRGGAVNKDDLLWLKEYGINPGSLNLK